jgi:KipI family sensor histidine kinase inhibitor
VELGDSIDPAVNARVRALDRALQDRPFPGFREAVPTYRSLLVFFDAERAAFEDVRAAVLDRMPPPGDEPAPGPVRRIPTVYGGEHGPDLARLAAARGLSEAEAIAIHASSDYTAFMLGFVPGFAYLGLLPEKLATPRLPTPRVRVPAGSVGVAGRQTGVYPVASPGGWNLIGRTSLVFFDVAADPPSLVCPGDRVRFVPVGELPPASGPASAHRLDPSYRRASSPRPAAVEVLEGGVLTTVQDAGRFGRRSLGVTWAGPMDAASHRAANALVSNPPEAAALECTVSGPSLAFLSPVHFAVVGADLGAVLERSDLGPWLVPLAVRVFARPGNVLRFTGRRSGCRAYVAFAGGVDAPLVLGSRATDLGSGFGGFEGRPLRAGDRLSLGSARAAASLPPPGRPAPHVSSTATVRVVWGPQDDHFTPESRARFVSEQWRVLTTSDRVGCRLGGQRLEHRGAAEIVSDGMAMGSVQVPPDGQPIVMMADAPTTGGYPKIATVLTAELPKLAQLLPGEGRVAFEAVTP